MKENISWVLTKTLGPHAEPLVKVNYLPEKYWLNHTRDVWISEVSLLPFALFKNRGEARKTLNKKLSYEIKNWGMEHVRMWVYKVEKLK